MSLASALEVVLNRFGVYDANAFVEVLRKMPGQLADFLVQDDMRALLAASVDGAHSAQTGIVEAADADVEPMVEVAVAEAMIADAFQLGDKP